MLPTVPPRVQTALLAIVAAVIIFLWADLGPSTPPSATQPSAAPAATATPGMAVADFCDRHGAMSEVFTEMYSVPPPDGLGLRIRVQAEEMLEAGPPVEMPADAKDGFRTLMNALTKLPEDANESDLTTLDGVLKLADPSGPNAFNAYAIETCALS